MHYYLGQLCKAAILTVSACAGLNLTGLVAAETNTSAVADEANTVAQKTVKLYFLQYADLTDTKELLKTAKRLAKNAPLLTPEQLYVFKDRITEVEAAYRQLDEQDTALALTLLRLKAQAASLAQDHQVAKVTWKQLYDQLSQQPSAPSMPDFYSEAAVWSAAGGDGETARFFYTVARESAVKDSDRPLSTELKFRLREMLVTTPGKDWREVEDEITDLRADISGEAIWSELALEALLGEIALRQELEPSTEQKKLNMSRLQAELLLAYRSQSKAAKPEMKAWYRRTLRLLEDTYGLKPKDRP